MVKQKRSLSSMASWEMQEEVFLKPYPQSGVKINIYWYDGGWLFFPITKKTLKFDVSFQKVDNKKIYILKSY